MDTREPDGGDNRAAHWRAVWQGGPGESRSWFQREPSVSLSLIEASGTDPSRPVIDIGGGDSRLVDRLLERGFADVTVLDIAPEALDRARARLGPAAARVTWIAADIARWTPPRRHALWHDRAVFHFLTGEADRRAYAAALRAGLAASGQAIVATFALDGPQSCSGLPVRRYDVASLIEALGGGVTVLQTCTEDHRTPSGAVQRFLWTRFRLAGVPGADPEK